MICLQIKKPQPQPEEILNKKTVRQNILFIIKQNHYAYQNYHTERHGFPGLKLKTSMANSDPEKIDLDKIIENKNKTLYKWLPTFIIRYIKRVVHQDELNDFLLRTKNAHSHEFVNAIIDDFKIHIVTKGLENIPVHGGCIIAGNHPLGGIDGIAIMREAGKVRKDIKALVNDLLMNLVNLIALLIPTNKHGKNTPENANLINGAYASGECIILFPAGLVSRFQNGKIEDLEWKKNFISQAVKHKRDIIPVYVAARNSNFFYGLSFLRKKLGIRANLEMFYLVDEAFQQKGKTIELTFGKPISYTLFTPDQPNTYWAEKVKKQVYGLKNS